jgi:hypothetical protein
MPLPTVTTASGRRLKSYPAPAGFFADARAGKSAEERVRQLATRLGWQPNDFATMDQFRTDPRVRRLMVRRMLSDEAVKGGLLQKVFGVGQLTLQVKPARKDNPADQQAAELCRFNIEERLPYGTPGLVENIALHALLEDHSLCEPVWPAPGILEEDEPWRGKRLLSDLKARHPDAYRLDRDTHGTITAVRYRDANNSEVIDDPNSFVIFSYIRLYASALSGYTDIEAAYNHFTSKWTAIRMRAIMEDRLSGGFLVVKGDPNSQQLKDDCAAARGMGYIILQHGNEAEILDLAGGSAETFRNGIQDRDKAIWTCFSGAYLHAMESSTPNARGGSRVALSSDELRQWHLASAVSNVVTRQLAPMIVRENIPGAAMPRLMLSAPNLDETEKEMRIGLLVKQLVGGENLGREQVYEKSNWGPPRNANDTLPEPVDPFADQGDGGDGADGGGDNQPPKGGKKQGGANEQD